MTARSLSLCSRCALDGPAPARMQHCIILVTERCNLRCRICEYGRRPAKGLHELPARAIIELVRDAQRLGCTNIVLTGGEPLLRKDLPEIFAAVCQRGIESSCAICTNGTALTRSTARALAAARPSGRVVVSLDGDVAAIHDRIRGPGAFKAAVAAITLLNDAFGDRKHVSVNTILTRENVGRLPRLIRRVAALGASGLKLVPVFGPSADSRLRLARADLLEHGARAPRLRRLAGSLGIELMDLTPYALLETAACHIPSFVCFVDSQGRVFGCNASKGGFQTSRARPLGVFRGAGDLEKIWTSPRYASFRRRALAKAAPECRASCADVTAHAMNFLHGPCGGCLQAAAFA